MNSNLTECRSCGKTISMNAMSCLHCGEKYKATPREWILIVLKFTIIFFLIWFAFALLGTVFFVIGYNT